MTNFHFIIATALILIPIFLYVLNKRYYYYSIIAIYPIIGQSISAEVNLFFVTINPSMLFGFLILGLTAIDFLLQPSKDRLLEILILIFISYALFSCFFSPLKFESFSWTLKIATWLLILSTSLKIFTEEQNLYQIHQAVSIAVVIVIFSFIFSKIGFYGKSITYETGVTLHGGGFETGKALAYHLAIAIPVLALAIVNRHGISEYFSIILIFTSMTVIILTFVRSPVIALLVGFVSYQYFDYRYGDKRFLKVVVIIFFITLTVISITFFASQSQYTSRWRELGDKYAEGRVEKLGSGRVGGLIGFYDYYFYKASVLRKVFGSGLGSSYVYLGTNIIIHNDFAEILMGCGIIGFTVYLFILLRVFRLLIHSLKKTKKPQIARAAILALSSFFVFVSFHMTNITSGVLVLSMWAIFNGATIGVAQASSKSDNEHSVHIL
jgi:hypothetical protein